MKYKKYLPLLLLIPLMLFPQIIHASGDVGNSHSSSMSSSSSDSSALIFIFYLLPFPLNLIVFIVIIFLISKKGVTNSASYTSNQNFKTITLEESVVKTITSDDEKFSKYAFYTYAKEAIINIQEALENKNIDSCVGYIDKDIKEMLQTTIQTKTDFYYQEQEILDVSLLNVKNSESYQYLTCQVFMTEIYYEQNENKQLQYGDKKNRIDSAYNIVFKRKIGTKTSDVKLSTSNCPSCGAPNSINNLAICQYCSNTVNNGDFSFIVSSVKKENPKSSVYYRNFHSNKLHALNNEDVVVSQIKVSDETFVLQEFESFVSESFLAVQEAWQKRDLTTIRHYETQDLYDIHSIQIQEFIQKEYFPYLENQQILDVHLNRYEIDGDYEYITVYLKCNLKIFKKDKDNNVIAGNEKKSSTRGYALRYKRKNGVTFKNQPINNCPNCGASIELGEIGNCVYCNSQIINGEHGFILDSYEAIYKI